MFFKNSPLKTQNKEELANPVTTSNSSLRNRAYRLVARAYNSAFYGRWFTDFPSLKNRDSKLWLLGKSYEHSQKDEFIADLQTRILLCYREQFSPLCDGKTKTDAGWSCTLRATQMLVAQALMVNQMGRDWTRCDFSPSDLRNVLRVFEDKETAPLGIHALVNAAIRLDFANPIGRWYKPSEAFVLIREAITHSHSTLLLDPLRILLSMDNIVVPREIEEASEDGTKTVVLIIPIRLGVEKVNESYYEHVQKLFHFPCFLGFVGGYPKHATWVVGCTEQILFHLDPHTCQKYVQLDGTEDDTHYETFHSKNVGWMNMKNMDPSCALGFMIRNATELREFTSQLETSGIAEFGQKMNSDRRVANPLFSVLDERPVYMRKEGETTERHADDNDTEFEMLTRQLKSFTAFNPIRIPRMFVGNTAVTTSNEDDKLFSKISLEVRGHDRAVLLSYTTFLKNACQQLEIESSDIRHLPYVRWVQWALRSKFAHKKNKLHYETRTYIKQMDVRNLTESTASTFLEYIERNIPEGVAMRVDYEELSSLPDGILDAQTREATK
ncbi:Cysteine protease [Aphelenchoides besseyi]|nr:Cysteine protease [Aphelenchoides besseyi]KAI6227954.1 Cysteine protease [Aphelenchoides besseyi]